MVAEEDPLVQIQRDIFAIRGMLTKVLGSIAEAESEIPEKMRRFVMYWHDIHDVMFMYEGRGNPPPPYLMREMERCDDRYRHILEDLSTDAGAFEKVRQEMSQRPGNRYDHTRLFPKETKS